MFLAVCLFFCALFLCGSMAFAILPSRFHGRTQRMQCIASIPDDKGGSWFENGKNKAKNAKDDLVESVKNQKDAIASKFQEGRSTVNEVGQKLGEKGSEMKDQSKEKENDIEQDLRQDGSSWFDWGKEKVGEAKDSVTDAKDKVMDSVTSSVDKVRDTSTELKDQVKANATDFKDAVKNKAQNAKDATTSKVRAARAKVSSKTSEMKNKVSGKIDEERGDL